MKIVLDCRMLGSSGVGVYLRECLSFFLRFPHEFLLLGDAENPGALESCLSPEARQEKPVLLFCAAKPFSLRELFFFPPALLRKINRQDRYWSPYFNIPGGIKIPVFTTIHDTVFHDVPGPVSRAGFTVRDRFYRRAVKKSRKIFTVSVFSRSRIEKHFGTGTPVIVAGNGVRESLRMAAGNGTAPGSGKKDIILFVGNMKMHKGLSTLLDAFLLAQKQGLAERLVIAGERENFRSKDTEFTRRLENTEGVEFTGFIPDAGLFTLLGEAKVLVQPSLYEGFGYPPLEALFAGTRAIVSDIPVFREIYAGFPVTFFRPGDAEDLKEKLLALLHDKEPSGVVLTEELAGRYTFEKTASVIMKELTERT